MVPEIVLKIELKIVVKIVLMFTMFEQVCSEAVLVRVEGAEYADCDGLSLICRLLLFYYFYYVIIFVMVCH